MTDSNQLTEQIIGAAIEVHRELGPGLLEDLYESALCVELSKRGIAHERQKSFPVYYKGHEIGKHRLDVFVDQTVVVELKAVEKVIPLYEAQLLSYLRVADRRVGLLINFNVPLLKNGVKRMVL